MEFDKRRIYQIEEVCEIFQIARVTLTVWVKEGQFPPPLRIGISRSAWRGIDLHEYVESRMEESRGVSHETD